MTIRKQNFLARNSKIKARVNELYNTNRIRFDDAVKKVSEEFNLAESTIQKILRAA